MEKVEHNTVSDEIREISVAEAAKILNVAEETVRRWLKRGVLKGRKTLTRQWMVNREALIEFAKTYR